MTVQYTPLNETSDAICINQNDFLERAVQVSLMDRIYSIAHQVVIWLGPLFSDVREAPRAIYDLATIDPFGSLNDDETEEDRTNPERLLIRHLRFQTNHKIQKLNWKSVARLLQRAWFQRVCSRGQTSFILLTVAGVVHPRGCECAQGDFEDGVRQPSPECFS
jgi:hypothetical protein